MSIDAATRAGAAPAAVRVAAHAGYELRASLRNGEQLLLTLILPAIILVVMSRTNIIEMDTGDLARVDVVVPGVLALAVMSSAFTSVAIATGFDRRAGALRMLATTPLGRGGLLGGKVLGVLALEVIQAAVLGGIGLVMGWHPVGAGIPVAIGAVILGTAAFTALALLLAGTLRAEAVLAGANLLWVLLLIGGGIIMPGPRATVALPSGALGEALRTALGHGGVDGVALLVLAAWTAVLTAATVRLFRWQ